MLLEKTRNFETFLMDSFQNDILKRELRLSISELEILKQTFPKAKVTKLSTNHVDANVDKSWYEIDIAG